MKLYKNMQKRLARKCVKTFNCFFPLVKQNSGNYYFPLYFFFVLDNTKCITDIHRNKNKNIIKSGKH